MAETEIIFAVDESPEGGYEARALGYSIYTYTQADTLAELREMVRDAVSCHFDEEDRPRVIRLDPVRLDISSPL
jgi:hypothetical protein